MNTTYIAAVNKNGIKGMNEDPVPNPITIIDTTTNQKLLKESTNVFKHLQY